MSDEQPKNPLHGITLATILEDLVSRRGWIDLGSQIDIKCFTNDPSMSSSLKFLRRNEWARKKVERLYLDDQRRAERNKKRNQRRKAMRAHRAAEEAGEPPPRSVSAAPEPGEPEEQ